MTYDVAVVGAGPAGLICATELEKLGEDVVVIEKDKKIGEPVDCAGLFNKRGLERLGIKEDAFVLNEVKGARFISASGKSADVGGQKNKAVVVDRGEFDRFLASKYSGELILEKTVKGTRKHEENFWLDVPGRAIEAKKVVLATGQNANLHKAFGLSSPKKYISTSQYEIKGVITDPDFVEMYVGSVAPGFFAWVIPVDEKVARVGLGILDAEKSTHHYMSAFLKRLKKEGKFKGHEKVVHKSGGLVPLFDPALKILKDGAYLVGDAAGQVKATTGGGVMLGGLAAKGLAQAIHTDTGYVSHLGEVGKELKNHLLIRKVINKFGDEQYENMIEYLNKPDVRKTIEKEGDMDLVGPLMKSFMKNPMMMMRGMKLAGRGLLF